MTSLVNRCHAGPRALRDLRRAQARDARRRPRRVWLHALGIVPHPMAAVIGTAAVLRRQRHPFEDKKTAPAKPALSNKRSDRRPTLAEHPVSDSARRRPNGTRQPVRERTGCGKAAASKRRNPRCAESAPR
jgi:hypothetical protein